MPTAPPPIGFSRVEFEDRVAVITGGAGGLGLHLVQTLVGLGPHVFFCDLLADDGRAAAAALGPKAHFVACDLRQPEAVTDFVRQAGEFGGTLRARGEDLQGGIDFLINNAAIDPRFPLDQATVEDFDRLVNVNLRPHFLTAQAALPYLIRGQGKSVVNFCTTNSMIGFAQHALYAASKSGIVGLTRALAREMGPHGIRVNTISPGWIMTARQLEDYVTERDKKDLLDAQCLKFLLTEEHVTPVTLFLLGSASRAVTGQNLVVDGGKVLQ